MSEGRLRVGLLFGGPSVEHEVSVVSARGVAGALDPARFECVPLAVTADGVWLAPSDGRRILESDAPVVAPPPTGVRLVADPGAGCLLGVEPGGLGSPVRVDVVFSVWHGWGGEDGRVQGMLDLLRIPYVGAGVLGSATGMDKGIAKDLFRAHGLPVVPWVAVDRTEWRREPSTTTSRVESSLAYPVFVKPANSGSSVGISKARRRDELGPALDEAFRHDSRAIVELGMDVREIEVAVLGNASPEASVPGEVVPSGEFYDYAAKYLDGASELRIPAPLPAGTVEEIRRQAVEAFRSLSLRGMARVDFFVEKGSGKIFVNEVNTLPGFTPISMYPKLWEASGRTYPELLARLVHLAIEAAAEDRERATRRGGHGR